jgi:hypothetical protein
LKSKITNTIIINNSNSSHEASIATAPIMHRALSNKAKTEIQDNLNIWLQSKLNIEPFRLEEIKNMLQVTDFGLQINENEIRKANGLVLISLLNDMALNLSKYRHHTLYIKINGNIDLGACTELISLPDNLHINGNLKLFECKNLVSLPDNLYVGGNLDLRECASITSLPDTLQVEGKLNLLECKNLTSLPQNFKVRGSLNLKKCTAITKLPDNLNVGGGLDLGNTSIVSLPNNLYVEEYLCLSGCKKLAFLPDNFKVNGNLYLFGSKKLKSLPDNLHICGDFFLQFCTSLKYLPNNLYVQGHLDLSGCTSLLAIPEDLKVDGNLFLNGCISLTSLPNEIISPGKRITEQPRRISLIKSGLSLNIINKLVNRTERMNTSPPIQFYFIAEPVYTQTFRIIEDAIIFWQGNTEQVKTVILDSGNINAHQYLKNFLSSLRSTKEYNNLTTQPSLKQRVKDMLNKMFSCFDYCNIVLEEIPYIFDDYDDQVIQILNQIELRLKIKDALNGPLDKQQKQLRKLAKGLCKLEAVHECAKEKCKSLDFVDEIEVVLYYETMIAKEIHLPINTNNIIFERYDNINEADLEIARKKVAKINENDIQRYLDDGPIAKYIAH